MRLTQKVVLPRGILWARYRDPIDQETLDGLTENRKSKSHSFKDIEKLYYHPKMSMCKIVLLPFKSQTQGIQSFYVYNSGMSYHNKRTITLLLSLFLPLKDS